ncbi:hypothetical protein [Variovorax sp. E3]|uniref:hypothetical protein n=1 Tax=Variovorax sp. E3 TaxID=1914993 RepID=UPI0018DBD6C9|nr:hypothetical protein [Variovorax sp. E3]
MTALFGLAIALAVIDGVLQYRWAENYFRFGLPVYSIDLQAAPSGSSDKYTIRKTDRGWMIRQKHYGLARYATHHGYAVSQGTGSGRCVFFVDLNVPFFGAFIVSAIVEPSLFAALLGAVLSWFIARLVVMRSAKSLAA